MVIETARDGQRQALDAITGASGGAVKRETEPHVPCTTGPRKECDAMATKMARTRTRTTFTLRIEMDNDAFVTRGELARLLGEAARQVGNVTRETGRVIDVNGNRVGEWIIA